MSAKGPAFTPPLQATDVLGTFVFHLFYLPKSILHYLDQLYSLNQFIKFCIFLCHVKQL